METPTPLVPNPKVTWSNSIGGVIIGLILHFLVIIAFVAVVKERLGINATPSAFALIMNFYISRWYIKDKGSKKFFTGSIWLGFQVSGFLILISIITTSVVLLGLNAANGGNGDGAKIIQSIPTFDSTSTIQESRVDLKYGMEAYCALPTEWKSENDSIQVTQFSLAVANYPEDQRDSMEKFANLYSRFVIDLMRDELIFIDLVATNNNLIFGYFSLEDQTAKEYDSLANYYGCKYVISMKKDHIAAANELSDSVRAHKKHKYLDSYLESRTTSIESGIQRNYWIVFHKVLLYI